MTDKKTKGWKDRKTGPILLPRPLTREVKMFQAAPYDHFAMHALTFGHIANDAIKYLKKVNGHNPL